MVGVGVVNVLVSEFGHNYVTYFNSIFSLKKCALVDGYRYSKRIDSQQIHDKKFGLIAVICSFI